MIKTIKIDGKNITFKSTGALMYRYKQQFGTEYIADIMKLNDFTTSKKKKKIKNDDGTTTIADDFNYSTLSLEVAYNLAWCLAKAADNNVPDPLTWLDSLDTFPIFDILPQLTELISLSNKSKN